MKVTSFAVKCRPAGSGHWRTMLNKWLPTASAIAIVSLLAAGSARASAIISSDIQPGDMFGPGIGIGLIPFGGVFNLAGVGFTPSQTYTFDSMELAISVTSGPNVLDAYLMGSADGLPSGILESFQLIGAMTHDKATSLVTIDSVTHPVVEAGMQYWIVAAGGPHTFASWQQNLHNDMGPNASGPSLNALARDADTNVIEAYQVNGTAAAPEPQSWMLAAGGALGLICRARSRKSRDR